MSSLSRAVLILIIVLVCSYPTWGSLIDLPSFTIDVIGGDARRDANILFGPVAEIFSQPLSGTLR